jgi:prolyl-tRNA synthetase
MRLSRFFLPILKENPKEAEIVSHRLMLRAGMIRQEAAGIYAWLPLGLKVLKKIEQIVREEQNRAGALELLMPTLQLADLWRESGRYDAYGPEMLRITDRHKRELLYGPTNEEMITEIFRAYVKSYKSLPINLYHIQWKFRDEQRPRFGVMRGREFLMKDAYSFDIDEAAARRAYNRMFVAYLRTFARMGLKAIPMRAETGPIGGDLSHEFIVLAETGESAVYCDRDVLDLPVPGEEVDYEGDLDPIIKQWTSVYSATEDVHDAARFDREVPAEKKVNTRGIEVGQIFYFGTKYSDSMKAMVAGPDGVEVAIHGGSYGVGVSRLVGAIIEACHDDAGIKWPEAVAPFRAVILNLKQGSEDTDAACERLYRELSARGVEVLYDDTDQRAGAKFAAADLIGIPWQILVGPKGLAEGKLELKRRSDGTRENLSPADVVARLGGGRVDNPVHIDTATRLASMRQIHCAIEHLHRGDFEAAITLAGAAEGMLPTPGKPFLFQKIKALRPNPSLDSAESDGANDMITWLKHGTGPDGKRVENARIPEIDVIAAILRAISKFVAVYDVQSPQMEQFKKYAAAHLSVEESK